MTDVPWDETEQYERLIDSTSDARLAYYRTLGKPDADVWFPLINPVFRGGPAWPTRPAWQYIRSKRQTIVASSGLSDPFSDADGPNVGFGVEVAVATADELTSARHPSWLLDLAQAISHQAASDGQFHLRHERFGVFLLGACGAPDVFQGWLDDTDSMGFLVGMPMPGTSSTIALPAGSATLLMAKLLTPAEYAFVAAHGMEGAKRLVEVFEADGTHHLSSLRRASVV